MILSHLWVRSAFLDDWYRGEMFASLPLRTATLWNPLSGNKYLPLRVHTANRASPISYQPCCIFSYVSHSCLGTRCGVSDLMLRFTALWQVSLSIYIKKAISFDFCNYIQAVYTTFTIIHIINLFLHESPFFRLFICYQIWRLTRQEPKMFAWLYERNLKSEISWPRFVYTEETT